MPPFFICKQIVNNWKIVLTIDMIINIIKTTQNDWG